MTPEFKAQFGQFYGRAYAPKPPDYSRCAAAVYGAFGNHQCQRKCGHGPHGAWCKQHDPVAAKQKSDARSAAWQVHWDAERARSKFTRDCIAAIRVIAAGHNDPRGLARGLVDAFDAAQKGGE